MPDFDLLGTRKTNILAVSHTDIIDLFKDDPIRDTTTRQSPGVQSNGMPFKTIRVGNGLDQAVDIAVEVSRDGVTWFYGAQLAGNLGANTNNTYGRNGVLSAPWPFWRLRVKASANPTAGVFNAFYIQHAN